MTDQETLDAIGRAQNSLLEEGECVHHHACPCKQTELDQLMAVADAARTVARYAPSEPAATVVVDAFPMIDLMTALDKLTPNSDSGPQGEQR